MYNARNRFKMAMVALTVGASFVLTGCGGTKSEPAATPASPAPVAPPVAAVPVAPAFDKLIIIESPVRGSANLTDEQKAALNCAPNAWFLRNEQIVWRIKVVDPTNGKELDDKGLSSVEVQLADGKVLKAKYGLKPKDKPVDGFWTASFTIPEDYPVGNLNYGISAKANDGRGGQHVKFMVASSALQVLADIRPAIKKAN